MKEKSKRNLQGKNKWIKYVDWVILTILILTVIWAQKTGEYDTQVVQVECLDGGELPVIYNPTEADLVDSLNYNIKTEDGQNGATS